MAKGTVSWQTPNRPRSPVLPMLPPFCPVLHSSSDSPICLPPHNQAPAPLSLAPTTTQHHFPQKAFTSVCWELPTLMPEGDVTTLPFQSFGQNVVFQLRRQSKQGQKQTREGAGKKMFYHNSTAIESEIQVPPISYYVPREQMIQAIKTEIHFYFLSRMCSGANI